jgi:peptidoglycan hydrolase-like protein with peptidoglycan-binding domain
VDTAFFGALAFLEMLASGRGGGGAAPAPTPSPYVPASAVVPPPSFHIPPPGDIGPPPTPAFHIPPPGDIGPPPPGMFPAPIPQDVPPAVVPPLDVPVPVGPVAPPGQLPPMPSWNQGITAPCPADLPPFPGPGWTPDTPVTDAVVARAQYWNPILWNYATKSIVHPSVCEQQGGRWLQFAAAWHAGDSGPQTYMATEAWRQVAASPMPTPVPVVVVPPPGPAPTPVVVQTPLQAAAVAMASALNAHGYKLADQPIYKRFQSAAKTTADGYPGTGTMGLLRAALSTVGLPMPNVPIYPWRSKPGTTGYDGVNAPTWAQWSGQAVGPAPRPAPAPVGPVAPQSGPPGLVGPYPGPGAWQTNGPYIARYQNALTWLASSNPAFNPQGVDGKFGPNTKAAVMAFQRARGVTPVDGMCGATTAAAIDHMLTTSDAAA